LQGVAASPVNIADGIRWNSALGYLDPVRDRPNLRIIGDVHVDRVEVANGRAIAVHAMIGGQPVRIPAARIVLAAGTYGSPAILLRSGIGPADDLRPLGIAPIHSLPGVGNGLVDHPTVKVHFAGTERLHRAMDDFEARQWRPDEQSLAKARSRRCTEAFDLHLYSVASHPPGGNSWVYQVYVSSVLPRSAGSVKLASTDPEAPPIIDHGYLSDVDGEDRAVLADGIELARGIGAAAGVAPLYGDETVPGSAHETRADLNRFIERTVDIYYHPTSTCTMGPASDPFAVVDPTGKIHGLDGLYVCDASIFPTLMRANTNLPAAMVAEHMAAGIGG
ncbi:MAG: GMC oxidoreductase, partial [Chloroflexota bacterium]|nr:GMC oxidoreductase [Chloroflexota bacterium]